jgi:hypothetical protein
MVEEIFNRIGSPDAFKIREMTEREVTWVRRSSNIKTMNVYFRLESFLVGQKNRPGRDVGGHYRFLLPENI